MPAPLHVWPVALGRSVVQAQGQAYLVADDWPDHGHDQAGLDRLGLLASGGDGGVAGPELGAQFRSADPGGDGPAASRQQGAEDEENQRRWGSAVERSGESVEPLARRGNLPQR
jgi:hypothetical protein